MLQTVRQFNKKKKPFILMIVSKTLIISFESEKKATNYDITVWRYHTHIC